MRSSRPDVSILMPAYNHEAYVEQAARSALDSADAAGVRAELRTLDDGSSDATLMRLRAMEDPRLVVESQPNAGAHAAFNRLLEEARGEFLFLLNSDDLFEPARVGRCLDSLDAGGALAVGSFVRVIDPEGAEIGVKEAWRSLPPWPRPTRGPALSDLGDPALALLEKNYLATTSNLAFRRQALEGAGGGPRFMPL
ncbi:MAG: glycosyltransferase family 2 protein, partial [Acidobacteriota bacterium]